MDSLGDDVVEDILLRLPLKTLFRFRVVARRYDAIISAQTFASRYQLLHPPLTGFVFQSSEPFQFSETMLNHGIAHFISPPRDDDGSDRSLLLSIDNHLKELTTTPTHAADDDEKAAHMRCWNPGRSKAPDHPLVILHACRGLLLCSRTHRYTREYYICNPVTKRWIALPVASLEIRYCNSFLSVEDEQEAGGHGGGLGGRFKVVRYEEPRRLRMQIETFSSETGEWRVVHLPNRRLGIDSMPFLWGTAGVVYGTLCSIDDMAIVWDHAGDHSFRLLPLPPGVQNHFCGNHLLGESGRGQQLLRFAQIIEGKQLEVWDMTVAATGDDTLEDDGSGRRCGWQKTNSVSLETVAFERPTSKHRMIVGDVELLGFHPTDDQLVLLGLEDWSIALYHMSHGVAEIVSEPPPKLPESILYFAKFFQYVHPAWPLGCSLHFNFDRFDIKNCGIKWSFIMQSLSPGVCD